MAVKIHYGSNGKWAHYSVLPADFDWHAAMVQQADGDELAPMLMLAKRKAVTDTQSDLSWEVLHDEYGALDVLCWWDGIKAPNMKLVGLLAEAATTWAFDKWCEAYELGEKMIAGHPEEILGSIAKKLIHDVALKLTAPFEKELPYKADQILSSLTANSGVLSPEMASKFAAKMKDEGNWHEAVLPKSVLKEAIGPATGLPFSALAKVCAELDPDNGLYKTIHIGGKPYLKKEVLSDFADLTKPLPGGIAVNLDTSIDTELVGPKVKDVPKGKPAQLYKANSPFTQGFYEYLQGDVIHPGELLEHQIKELLAAGAIYKIDPPAQPSQTGMFTKEGGPYGKLKHHKPAPNQHAAPSIGGVVVEGYALNPPAWTSSTGYWTHGVFSAQLAERLLLKNKWKKGVRVRNLYVQFAETSSGKTDYRITGQVRVVSKPIDGENNIMWKKFDVIV